MIAMRKLKGRRMHICVPHQLSVWTCAIGSPRSHKFALLWSIGSSISSCCISSNCSSSRSGLHHHVQVWGLGSTITSAPSFPPVSHSSSPFPDKRLLSAAIPLPLPPISLPPTRLIQHRFLLPTWCASARFFSVWHLLLHTPPAPTLQQQCTL